jgi:hypothetical protein
MSLLQLHGSPTWLSLPTNHWPERRTCMDIGNTMATGYPTLHRSNGMNYRIMFPMPRTTGLNDSYQTKPMSTSSVTTIVFDSFEKDTLCTQPVSDLHRLPLAHRHLVNIRYRQRFVNLRRSPIDLHRQRFNHQPLYRYHRHPIRRLHHQ